MERSQRVSFPRGGFAALVLLALSLSLGGCATAPAGHTQLSWPVGTTYTVRDGDTLSEIAEDLRVSQDSLVRYNGLRRPNDLYVGEVLRIPRDSYVARSDLRPRPGPTPRPASYVPPPRRTAVPAPTPAPARVEQAQAYSGTPRFIWPVDGRIISSFGATPTGGRNDGINIAVRLGEPVRAAAGGTVLYAGNELKGYGNLVLIRHEDGYVTAYAHAERIAVARGDIVKKGQVIGYAGATGDVTRPQLHFEIRRGVQPIDPKPLLVAAN